MKKVLLVGGKNNKSLSKKGKQMNIEVVHQVENKKEKRMLSFFEKHVNDVDCIILYVGACSHKNMWEVRKLAKEHRTPIVYSSSQGATGAFQQALRQMKGNKENFLP
ncbi:DUF2325 domain-containing protein [Virgibacillus xinjiangensis]|uniref:DUF2325 domain-containing protein n=1 Tax=Virgibacillus xinjiangensis TaxID=393090 RepID=A0ABV7CVX8_9BACI